jgi:hypothetical protein
VTWEVVVGAAQAASPLGFWWLDPATVYVGFPVADGRSRVIAIECAVAMTFVVIAATRITGPAWLLVLQFAAHGLKDAWHDCVVALALAIEIVGGVRFQA